MVSHLFFYQLVLIALVWLCVMLQWAWPSDSAAACPTTLDPHLRQDKVGFLLITQRYAAIGSPSC